MISIDNIFSIPNVTSNYRISWFNLKKVDDILREIRFQEEDLSLQNLILYAALIRVREDLLGETDVHLGSLIEKVKKKKQFVLGHIATFWKHLLADEADLSHLTDLGGFILCF